MSEQNREVFARLEQNFLALEQAPGDLEILKGIFRGVRALGGAPGVPGLERAQVLARLGENLLDGLRQGRIMVDAAVIDLLFETEDLLRILMEDVGISLRGQRAPADPDSTGLMARLEATLSASLAH